MIDTLITFRLLVITVIIVNIYFTTKYRMHYLYIKIFKTILYYNVILSFKFMYKKQYCDVINYNTIRIVKTIYIITINKNDTIEKITTLNI